MIPKTILISKIVDYQKIEKEDNNHKGNTSVEDLSPSLRRLCVFNPRKGYADRDERFHQEHKPLGRAQGRFLGLSQSSVWTDLRLLFLCVE